MPGEPPVGAVRNLVDLFRWRAERDDDRTAFTFLEQGEIRETLTWRTLDEAARRTAVRLQSHGVRPGDRVPISYPSGLDYIVAIAGVLYAGAIAVPLPHGNPRRLAYRLGSVVEDCAAACVLAPRDMRAGFVEAEPVRLSDLAWLDVETRSAFDPDAWRPVAIDEAATAVLQYTSGSIGDPKACVVGHGHVLRNEEMIRRAFGHDDETVVVGWLPFYHDMGLFGNILQSVFIGSPCVLFSSTEFFREPIRWPEAIARFGGTTSGGPNFAYDLCARRIAPAQLADLDLRRWRLAFNGAEPVQAETLARFSRLFAPTGFLPEAFYPCYGMAEATLFVTGPPPGRPPAQLTVDAQAMHEDRIVPVPAGTGARTLVGCGVAGVGQRVVIVDPERREPQAEGRIGEIWIDGPNVVGGYYGKPQATEETFHARLAGDSTRAYLRTGDLGCMVDSELYVTGRLKDLIILRGRNYHPHDLERIAEQAHPAIRPGGCAAFAVADGDEGEERLVLVCEVEHRGGFVEEVAADAVRSAIADALDIGVNTIVFVRAGQVPKTTSGKTRRHACRTLFLEDGLVRIEARGGAQRTSARAAGRSEVAERVVTAAAQLLGRPAAELPRDRSLPALGMDSLMMARFALRLEAQGASIPPTLLHDVEGLDALIAHCEAHRAKEPDVPAPQTDSGPASPTDAPLTDAQRSLWLHAALFPDSPAYNLCWAARLNGPLDVGALESAFVALQAAHPALRTRVELCDGALLQRWDARPAALEIVDASGWDEARLRDAVRARADTPFDLRSAAPVDAALYARSDRERVLLVRIHHIAMDLASLPLLIGEWQARCGDRTAPPMPSRGPVPGDGVRSERAYLASADADIDLAYWRTQFRDAVAPPATLPGRREGPSDRRRGAAVSVGMPPSADRALREIARGIGCTPFEIHLAVYATMLAHWTGRDRLAIGVPFDLRASAGLQGMVGYCVNLLPIVVDVDRGRTFRELVREIGRALSGARRHARMPLETMAERLGAARSPGQTPLVDAVFVWRTLGADDAHAWHVPGPVDATLAGGRIEVLDLGERGSQFDFAMIVSETGSGTTARIAFDPEVLGDGDARRAARRFEAMRDAVVVDVDAPLAALALLGDDERHLLVEAFRGPERAYPPQATLLGLLLDRAARAPDAIALCGAVGGPVAGEFREVWTYGQLHETASRIAATLMARGHGGRDARIGVAIERSAAMVAAILAAIHSGACYLPLDPDEPDERLRQLLAGSDCVLVLSTAAHAGRAAFSDVEVVDVGSAASATAAPAPAPVDCRPGDLAYVIHTSGSTGLPKPVMVEHRSIVNRLLWMAEALELDARDVFLQKTPTTFDVSVWELFLPLLLGSPLVLLPPGGERDPPVLVDHLRRFGVTIAHFVPSMLFAFLAHLPQATVLPAWRRCICSGEKLEAHLRDRFVEAFAETALINLYGPTEAAVDVTWHVVRAGETDIPIGRAVANTTLRILDAHDRLVPIGTSGELCLCGVQVARGYLNQPEATARAFGVDPVDGRTPMYRTGDFARWRDDGTVEYLGRRDAQVKIRGRRVEFGEIEHALSTCPGVRGAAVATRADDRGDIELVAFLLCSELPPLAPLVARLRTRLPRPLVPSAYAAIDGFPLTASGKLDRNALPFERLRRAQDGFEPPRTPRERTLSAIWAAELSASEVGAEDNFFDLGGDSIRALRIVAEAGRNGLNFTVADLFRRPTVRALAAEPDVAPTAEIAAPQPFGLIPDAWRERLPDDVEDAYPLSCIQQSLVFLSETSRVYEIYVTSLRLRGRFDAERLADCMRDAVQRHPFLRASFDLAGFAEGVQRIHRHVEVPFEVFDWRHLPPDVQSHALEDWIRTERKRAFAWDVAPMLRFAAHRWSEEEFQFTLSDAALDGWCVASLMTEVLEAYAAVCEGRTWSRSAPVTRYADFIALERAAIADEATRGFWHDKMARFESGTLRRPPRPPGDGPRLQGRVTVAFDAEVCAAIAQLARSLSVPFKSALIAAHMQVLSTLCGRRVVSGLEVNGRPETLDGDRVIGVFNNTVPLCLELDGGAWSALIRACWRAEQELQPHRRYPYHHLRKAFGETPFDAVFVYTDFHVYRRIMGTEAFEVLSASGSDQTFFSLTAHFNRDLLSDSLQLLLDFDPGQWSEESVRALARAYREALAAMIASPEASHARLCAPRTAAPVEASPQPAWPDALAPIAAHARTCPDRIAVACGDARLTYAALWREAGEMALRLRAQGATVESLVAVDMHRSCDLLVALLGVWRSGAAFLPLNPADPPERRERILSDAGATLVLTDRSEAIGDPARRWTFARLRASPIAPGRTLPSSPDPRQAAYTIYTSGSTGAPKGVVVPHGALAAYLSWAIGHYALVSGEVPVHTATSFDLTITSQIAPLVAGATVRLLADEDGAAALAAALAEPPPFELIKLTPSHLEYLARAAGPEGPVHPPAALVVGGEALRAESLRAWRRRGVRIFNEYGPTEATVGCCVHEVREDDPDHGAVPIGRAIAGTRLHVLDPWGVPVAPGLVGELWIAGAGLARGYHGSAAATADRFRPDPFAETPGGRLYRSGDLVREREDGLLEYLDRMDRQLKIRGFRIEPSEIESALCSHPRVDAAAVVARTVPGGTRLAAYVISKGDPSPDIRDLRAHLAARLPEAMVPAVIAVVDAFPLTRNGKIDLERLALTAVPDERARLLSLLERIESASAEELASLVDRTDTAEGARSWTN
ncbi:MAG: amino acid adenylation domain-containing protein [Pseudomonadota bacterium]